MSRQRGKARETIIESAEALVRKHGAAAVTVEAVAKAAGTAKGLVHYHYKTKQGLLGAVADRLTASRTSSWANALRPGAAESAAEASWRLLTRESATGVALAWQTLLHSGSTLPDQAAKSRLCAFSSSLGTALTQLFADDMGLVPTVPTAEIGWLMAAVVDGVGLQLLAGVGEEQLHGAYAAAWLGLLALAAPA
ncbi:MAG: TetR/AcrR family transcriptional regulator [Gemmatimonadota bacterium]|nr:MAG: TetR/AcrR family transcriptional regulator [Gemmatimonadota bacterium]